MNVNYWEENYHRYPPSEDYDGWLDDKGIRSGCRVLDLGCGSGVNIPALLKVGAVVTAADYSAAAVEVVRRRFGDALYCAECFDMRQVFPYPDVCFEAVVADLSLHYFRWEDTRKIIAEIGRVLVPGGRLIARVHSLKNAVPETAQRISENYYFADGFPRRYFSAEEIRLLFAGWELAVLQETAIRRYDRTKHVIAFTAIKQAASF